MFLNDCYAVDLIAMSYSVLDKMHFEEIKHFFEVTDYKWDYIMFQFGRHGAHIKCMDLPENEKEYTDKLSEVLLFLKKWSPNLIALSLTMEHSERLRFSDVNRELNKRNEIMGTLAKDLGIRYFDLNGNMDYKEIEYVDGIHFSEDSYEYVARMIIANLFPDIVCAESNRILLNDEFMSWICRNRNKKIYIYGNGKRRKLIESFLQEQQISIEGVIVSEKYKEEHTILLDEVKKEDSVIIVTPREAEIWKRLQKNGYTYISIGTTIYEQMDEV